MCLSDGRVLCLPSWAQVPSLAAVGRKLAPGERCHHPLPAAACRGFPAAGVAVAVAGGSVRGGHSTGAGSAAQAAAAVFWAAAGRRGAWRSGERGGVQVAATTLLISAAAACLR